MPLPETDGVTVEAFEAGDIDAEQFDHEAHVYAAWLFLDAYPIGEAGERFVSALKRLTVKLGVPDKYHDTITRFYLAIIAERRDASPERNWTDFKASNDDLFSGPGNVLSRYYTKERLGSDAARQAFVLPDRRDATETVDAV